MASLTPSHTYAFADALKLGDVFSVHRDGRDEVRVVAEPEPHKNLVGERSFIVLRVNRLKPREFGEMILCPTNVVYVRNSNVPRETSEETHADG